MTASQITNNTNELFSQDFFILNEFYAVGEDKCVYQIVNEKDLSESLIVAYKTENGTVFNYAEDGSIYEWNDQDDILKYWSEKGSKVEFSSVEDKRLALDLANAHFNANTEYDAEDVSDDFVFIINDNDEIVDAVYRRFNDGGLAF